MQDIKSGVVRDGIVRKGSVGNIRGWAFDVIFNGRKYPNIISALYKTKEEAIGKLIDYFENDKLDTYGSAE